MMSFVEHSVDGLHRVTKWPTRILIGLIVVSTVISVGYAMWQVPRSKAKQVAFNEPYLIEITGKDKTWYASYPDTALGCRGSGGVKTGREIHAPLGTKIIFVLKSTDLVYTFAIPQHDFKEIAVPGLEFRIELEPTKAAQLELVGEQLCGDPHSAVTGRIVIEPPDRFLKWRNRQQL